MSREEVLEELRQALEHLENAVELNDDKRIVEVLRTARDCTSAIVVELEGRLR